MVAVSAHIRIHEIHVPIVCVQRTVLRSSPPVTVGANKAETQLVVVATRQSGKSIGVQIRDSRIRYPAVRCFEISSSRARTTHIIFQSGPLRTPGHMPPIRTNTLMIHGITQNCEVISRGNAHDGNPRVQASVFRAAVRTVFIAPAAVHRIIQIFRHPGLRSDCDRSVSLIVTAIPYRIRSVDVGASAN